MAAETDCNKGSDSPFVLSSLVLSTLWESKHEAGRGRNRPGGSAVYL